MYNLDLLKDAIKEDIEIKATISISGLLFYVKKISIAEFEKIQKIQNDKSTKDELDRTVKFIASILVDANGDKILDAENQEHLSLLKNFRLEQLTKIVDDFNELNGVSSIKKEVTPE